MEHGHYGGLFAGLIFGNNPAANDRSGVAAANRAIRNRSNAPTKVEQPITKLFGVLPLISPDRLKQISGGCSYEMAPRIRARCLHRSVRSLPVCVAVAICIRRQECTP